MCNHRQGCDDGRQLSHANNKTRRRWEPNLQWKRIWIPSEGRFFKMRVSMRGLRTMQQIGVEAALLSAAKAKAVKKK
jgi:large subunit ribosomal protein L28